MKMTLKLANTLMDNLACLAISALGIPSTKEEMEKISNYARDTFISITHAWEKELNQEWNIIEEE